MSLPTPCAGYVETEVGVSCDIHTVLVVLFTCSDVHALSQFQKVEDLLDGSYLVLRVKYAMLRAFPSVMYSLSLTSFLWSRNCFVI